MVFKPFHLSRQSFGKALTHGYAQSVVAAAQSSHASSTTSFAPFGGNHAASRFAQLSGPKLHNAFQPSNSSTAKAGQLSNNGGSADGGLAAYYAAWQQQHSGDEDAQWKQFKFPLRIGWKEGKGKEREEPVDDIHQDAVQAEEYSQARSAAENGSENSREAGIPQKAGEKIVQAEELPQAEEKEVSDVVVDAEPPVDELARTGQDTIAEQRAPTPPPAPRQSPALSGDTLTGPVSDSTAQVTESQSLAYAEHLSKLQTAERYAEIPAVFESMLVAGIKPTAAAYNSLIAAAMNFPSAKHQAILKVLDIYADMLRRRVLPNMATYSIMINLLASHALDVSDMKQSLKERRIRFGGMEEAGKFMFPSNEAEFDMLVEDDSLSIAIKLFDASASARKGQFFSAETYRLMITVCAEQGRLVDMIRIYADIDSGHVVPSAATFVPMIKAFASAGDLSSAVECYDEYKALAIASDKGVISVTDRRDGEVYAAVIRGYIDCGKFAGALKFWEKVNDSYAGLESFPEIKDQVISNAFVDGILGNGNLIEALRWADELETGTKSRDEAMSKICIAAADSDTTDIAVTAFQSITSEHQQLVKPCISLLAHFVRQGDVEQARTYWNILSTRSLPVDSSFTEPTSMYAVALIGSGQVENGLMEARLMFSRIRSSADINSRQDTIDQIDEGVGFIGRFLVQKGIALSSGAMMELMWTMIENGGLVTPVVDQVLAGLGPETVSQLNFKDLVLMLEVQAGTIIKGSTIPDMAAVARFSSLFETALSSGMRIPDRTADLIEETLNIMGGAELPQGRPDLVQHWHNYIHPTVEQVLSPVSFTPTESHPASVSAPSSYEDTFDPYGASTDYKGSSMIVDELERNSNRSSASRLNEALTRFRNIRRTGRHPRYITYAKLIAAAAREERVSLVHDILGMARQDIPYLPQYRVVRYGWSSILDSMVGACLTLGNRALAAQFHQELLDMGAAPTANTYGLYITTMKESTKTFDEASEALKIFHRAKAEGVEPSSFLYNALIGKLGKARRIDDCLFYFAEMRELGIRPTSVTYGTIVNALCRVSDEKFAEELFEEMETMPNYKPRPAPYNSLMQFFLTTKRDKFKVLAYYERMKSRDIKPTMHTYKLLIDTHATLEPTDMAAAEAVLDTIRNSGQQPEAVHYASLIHAKGCVLRDMDGARQVFDSVLSKTNIRPQASLYQALFEAMVANHRVADTEALFEDMSARRVEMTPYIANTLIHGWATEKNIAKSKAIYEDVGIAKREPSTYEAMTRAFLAVEDRESAMGVVQEMLSRGYPAAVSGKVAELVSGGASAYASSIAASDAPA
jgi:pentatricopeptide repeat protein